jgi:hypothetical protein
MLLWLTFNWTSSLASWTGARTALGEAGRSLSRASSCPSVRAVSAFIKFIGGEPSVSGRDA